MPTSNQKELTGSFFWDSFFEFLRKLSKRAFMKSNEFIRVSFFVGIVLL